MSQKPLTTDDPRLTAYVLGELSPGERAEIERAVAASRELAAEAERLREFCALLKSALVAEAPAPAGQALQAAPLPIVSAGPAALSRARSSWGALAPCAAALACALVVFTQLAPSPVSSRIIANNYLAYDTLPRHGRAWHFSEADFLNRDTDGDGQSNGILNGNLGDQPAEAIFWRRLYESDADGLHLFLLPGTDSPPAGDDGVVQDAEGPQQGQGEVSDRPESLSFQKDAAPEVKPRSEAQHELEQRGIVDLRRSSRFGVILMPQGVSNGPEVPSAGAASAGAEGAAPVNTSEVLLGAKLIRRSGPEIETLDRWSDGAAGVPEHELENRASDSEDMQRLGRHVDSLPQLLVTNETRFLGAGVNTTLLPRALNESLSQRGGKLATLDDTSALGVLSKSAQQALPSHVARERAQCDGRYSELLEKLTVPTDAERFGEFFEYGRWEGTEYAGRTGLPAGHWVYVAPDWYIWGVSHPPAAADP
ncbi:MAG: hypothetical protein KF774_11300 [Planctomyces sp.]|nr:hypothetical protein [Planctomyces sp.]